VLKPFIVLSVPLLLALWLSAQQTPPPPPEKTSLYAIPLADSQKDNPVKPSPESLARGKRQYGYDCVMCHGKTGDGKGDVAIDMKLKMHDESDPATLKDVSDGALFYILKKGKDQMPPEAGRVKDEELWDMVNYVRTFAKKGTPTESKPAEEKAPN
jgi:mono/diheme cytochrome c family protein